MAIDTAAFTPVTALLGGALIGLATAVLLLALGRIAGISGIVGGLLAPALVGLCPGPSLVALGFGLPRAVVFVGAMLAGMALFEVAARYMSGRTRGT